MHSPTAIYEVRCPRCDVSFPVGTRNCIHCGNPTVGADRVAILESMLGSSTAPDDEFSDLTENPSTVFFPDQSERELETSDEPSSVGRSLIRSLGGFIWVVVLIGFTLARNCGGE
jgi:hypothetical protein